MDGEYLKGTWLEMFVWDEARKCQGDRGLPLFNDCDFSFEILSNGARKEVDVGCIFHGQLIHCSCKTEAKPFKTEHLDELRAVSSLVGGRFTTRVFVTNAFPPDQSDHSAYPEFQRFLEQARDREIVVVTGDNLSGIGQVLKREALKPTYARI